MTTAKKTNTKRTAHKAKKAAVKKTTSPKAKRSPKAYKAAKAAKPFKPQKPAIPLGAARLAKIICTALDDKKGENIVVIHIGFISGLCDLFVLCTGNNARHVATLLDAALEAAAKINEKPMGCEGEDTGWALIDFGDVVVHIFDSDTREFYDLERLWLDAPRVDAKTLAAVA